MKRDAPHTGFSPRADLDFRLVRITRVPRAGRAAPPEHRATPRTMPLPDGCEQYARASEAGDKFFWFLIAPSDSPQARRRVQTKSRSRFSPPPCEEGSGVGVIQALRLRLHPTPRLRLDPPRRGEGILRVIKPQLICTSGRPKAARAAGSPEGSRTRHQGARACGRLPGGEPVKTY
jgi:hypothetical protein